MIIHELVPTVWVTSAVPLTPAEMVPMVKSLSGTALPLLRLRTSCVPATILPLIRTLSGVGLLPSAAVRSRLVPMSMTGLRSMLMLSSKFAEPPLG